MRFAHNFRRVATILLLVGGFLSCLASAWFMRQALSYFGSDYPGTLSTRLPAATSFLLENFSVVASFPIQCAGAAIMLVVVAALRSSTLEARNHYLSMISAFLYLASFMTTLMFTFTFFVLPKGLSGAA